MEFYFCSKTLRDFENATFEIIFSLWLMAQNKAKDNAKPIFPYKLAVLIYHVNNTSQTVTSFVLETLL